MQRSGRGSGHMLKKVLLIERRYWIVAAAIVAAAAAFLLWQGRPPICTCGTVKLFVAEVASSDNSQHLADFYSPSHIIHGFIFYGLFRLALRKRPPGEGLVLATLIEASWELVPHPDPRQSDAQRADAGLADRRGEKLARRRLTSWPPRRPVISAGPLFDDGPATNPCTDRSSP